jgi:acyl-CoA hydrolase
MKVKPEPVFTSRLVKSEDLNHHGTLFAGRTAEWFVESGFISLASLVEPKNIVCLKIHGMYFSKPVKSGEVLKFTSKAVYAGRTSLISYIKVTKQNTDEPIVDGFITFIHVDDNTLPKPHGIEIEPFTEEDIRLCEMAASLKKK